MSFLDVMSASDVHDARSFSEYVQQHCGTPYCRNKDMMLLNKAIKEFKERYPHLADNPWPTLCRAAMWVRSERKRPNNVSFLVQTMLPWAWSDGALPELDPQRFVDTDVETEISMALGQEDDPIWRDRLIGSEGIGRKEVLTAWKLKSSPSLADLCQ